MMSKYNFTKYIFNLFSSPHETQVCSEIKGRGHLSILLVLGGKGPVFILSSSLLVIF